MNQRKASEIAPEVIETVRRTLEQAAPEAAESGVLLLLSGGGDSTALLLALGEILPAGTLSALHVNYGLRGADSDADAAFCVDLCAAEGVDLRVVEAGDPAAGNLQDWARDVRYDAAEERARELGSETLIATAHTADDQAETILYRLFASPGRRALRGIPLRRGRIVRPLMALRRAELRDWLGERGQDWREDASNEDPQFARVRARKLLAEAEDLHPAAVTNLLRTAAALRAEGDEIEAVVDGLAVGLITDDGALDLERLGALPPALGGAVLRRYVEERRPGPVPKAAQMLDEVLRLGQSGARRELQMEGARLEIRRGRASVIAE